MVREYLITFTLDGKRYQQKIIASSPTDAKRIVLNQYHVNRIAIINCKDLKMGYFC